MILISGLGNPGTEFNNTRHNFGFDIVDSIHQEFEFGSFSKATLNSHSDTPS